MNNDDTTQRLPRLNPNRVPRHPVTTPIPFEVQVEIVNEYNDGYSMRTVAKKHGIATTTVSRIIARAREQEDMDSESPK